ncbi:MAG: BMC domain-containing protein [Tissierellales bacterium]|jgi:microcompartment protein CcmL/EutN|nr:BMC domain-containing protein [Tissierellales bacterium]
MQSIGLIETKGLLAAIEAADMMVKSADVSILEKTYVGGGLVSIIITGDVSAVKAAVDVGVAAVNKLDRSLLISSHVIARPHEELDDFVGKDSITPNNIEDLPEEQKIVEIESEKELNELEVEALQVVEDKSESEIEQDIEKENDLVELSLDLENIKKEDLDNLVESKGLEEAIDTLSKIKVVKLRNLAREYKDFVIKGRTISKAGKKTLISKFRVYYEKK